MTTTVTRSFQIVVKLAEDWLAPDGKTVMAPKNRLVWLEAPGDEFRCPKSFWEFPARDRPNSYFKTYSEKPTKAQIAQWASVMWPVKIDPSDMCAVEFVETRDYTNLPAEMED